MSENVYLSQTDYAIHRGISQPRVSKLISTGKLDGCLKKIGKYTRIDRDAADKALDSGLDKIHNPGDKRNQKNTKRKPKKVTELPIDAPEKIKKAGFENMTLAQAQEVQAQYKAALMKLEFEEKSKVVVKVEDVEKSAFNISRTVRDSILNIPDRISAEIASLTDVFDVREKLLIELTESLKELSS